MLSTVWFGWDPNMVSAFMSKYAAVQGNLHGIDSPLRLINPANDTVSFQAAFLVRVASNLDGVCVDENYAVVCLHVGLVASLINELDGLAADAWIRVVLQQGTPLLGKLARMRLVACGKPRKVFVRENVLFE